MNHDLFYLREGPIYAVPVLHYNMETAARVRQAFEEIRPDCVAVELPETMQLKLLHAASRLPDVSIVITYDKNNQPIYYLAEPCDGAFEGLRSALEAQLPAFCIDLDVDYYPHVRESVPDPYSIQRIGFKNYYEAYQKITSAHAGKTARNPLDCERELYMAKRLKELSFSFDKILFIGGMYHIQQVLEHIQKPQFPSLKHAERGLVEICTLTEDSCREVMAEYGWISSQYETLRQEHLDSQKGSHPVSPSHFSPDRQKLIYQLYKQASDAYIESTGNPFPGYHLRNIMKFVRNYALINQQLMPDLFQILTCAKGCVDPNYAYETWLLGTAYPYRKNIDALSELDLSVEDIWQHSKIIRFQLKQKGRKGSQLQRRRKDRTPFRFKPPGPFSICSYQPEDVVIERFGEFLKKKGTQILTEESSRVIPFSSSIEDGVDAKETIRHLYEKKLYVKVHGKPPGGVGSVVVIFDEDKPEENQSYQSYQPYHEKYPWHTTWLGEHNQESDMAFYATPITANVVGPGISRCEYGGFMMSYPPRRMGDIWSDPDYEECRSKSEVLLMAAIDYSVQPLVTYMASSPPRSFLKSFARRYGKKIVYIPIGQVSPILINKMRSFHVLDGHDTRKIADEYIF